MLKKVLWLALACAVLLAALAFSRGMRFDGGGERGAPRAPVVEEAAQPVAAAPAPKAVEAPPQPTPEELQMQEDAAAVGMMNADPSPESPESDPSPEPPTN
jgi:hypothetical protein